MCSAMPRRSAAFTFFPTFLLFRFGGLSTLLRKGFGGQA
jgi:hypothetical protein